MGSCYSTKKVARRDLARRDLARHRSILLHRENIRLINNMYLIEQDFEEIIVVHNKNLVDLAHNKRQLEKLKEQGVCSFIDQINARRLTRHIAEYEPRIMRSDARLIAIRLRLDADKAAVEISQQQLALLDSLIKN